jgi:hypothetical protein
MWPVDEKLHDVAGIPVQTWAGQIGPLVLAAIIPLLRYILVGLLDWYARRVMDDLAQHGLVERRRRP